MTDLTMQSTEHDLSKMLGGYLRQRTASAKDLARRIGCDPRSAEGYRAGRYWPQAKHWPGLIAAFGRDVTDAVFHSAEASARLAREVAELEQQLAERRAALGLVAGDHRSFSPRVAKAAAEVRTRA